MKEQKKGNNLENLRLFVNQRPAGSVFRIAGDDEDALTAALAHCIVYSRSLLRAVLKNVGFKNLRARQLESARIFYQRHVEDRQKGISDMEIVIPGKLHVIIEAKIRAAFPELEQCRKYISRLNAAVPKRSLAVLLDAADIGVIAEYQSRDASCQGLLKPLLWANIYEEAQRRLCVTRDSVESYLLSELCGFMEGEYYMKSFEEEVWVVPLNTKPLWEGGISFYDIPLKHRIYFHPAKRSRRKAIYFAGRARGRVEHVQRILKVEYNKPPQQYIPELAKKPWGSEKHTIFHLGEPVNLPRAVKSGPIRNRLAYVDFDLLINAQTIDEAHRKTIRRRKDLKVRGSPSPQ